MGREAAHGLIFQFRFYNGTRQTSIIFSPSATNYLVAL